MGKTKENAFAQYHLKYALHATPGKYPVSKLQPGEVAQDAIVLATVRFDGSRVTAHFTSIDGRQVVTVKDGTPKPLGDFDMFQCWLTWGMALLEGQLHPRLKRLIRTLYTEIERQQLVSFEGSFEGSDVGDEEGMPDA